MSQLSPQTSTRRTMAVRSPWNDPTGNSPDAQFLRTWLRYNSLRRDISHGRINWGVVYGVLFALGVSAAFWAGFGWMVTHIWK
jgi:hypothetical protein